MNEYNDDKNIIAIKQLLKNSINNNYYDYIKNKIQKNVEDCNLLYTQVCYLIKLFILYEFEKNINLNYDFNEIFIRFCFKLIKKDNSEYILSESEKKDDIKCRFFNFYKDFNTNNIHFIYPNNTDSITHITNSLSRIIITNIKNNININYYKYLYEYIKINLKIQFETKDFEISNIIIKSVLDDIVKNTFYSNKIFHLWIIENKKNIIPDFDKKFIFIDSITNGILNYPKIVKSFIINYNKNDIILDKLSENIKLKKEKKIMYDLIYEDIINNTLKSDEIFHIWIKNNISLIINSFNSLNCIDIDSKLSSNPFIFIKNMLFMNKNLELNNSKKHYQIIPLRTNMRPKFIPINTNALVDILDSEYLDNIKNYYHNDNSKGIDIWNKYFIFSSDFIKNTIKKGFIFSGLILTNGYEIIFNFYSKKELDNKNNFHSLGKEEIKNKKELIKNLSDFEKEVFEKEYNLKKEENKILKIKDNNEKYKKKKELEKELNDIKLKDVEDKLIILNNKYNEDCEKIKNIIFSNNNDTLEYKSEKYKSSISYLNHCFNRNKDTIINDYKNNIDEIYKQLLIDDEIINNKITELKIILKKYKNNLKRLKSKKIKYVSNILIKDQNNIIKTERKNIVKLLNKIRIKRNLLNYECEDKSITYHHINNIKKTLINLINKNEIIKNIFISNYIDIDILKKDTEELKIIIDSFILLIVSEIKTEKYKKIELNTIQYINKKEDDKYYLKYNEILEEINILSSNLCKELVKKKNNNNILKNIFKTKDNEYMKIDDMSQKYLKILEDLNWCVIDPGINSIFRILSKDCKKSYNYSKKFHNNRTSFYKINKKIIKIKKEKIIKIEEELSKDNNRLKTSNDYERFKIYYNKKMLIHKELESLYNDERLNKLKWNLFINEKRSENMIINDIKKKFGNDVVLILGDWSMNKKIIKGLSSTPNKKYTRILENNFITLKINEYRTSIIHNKLNKICENYTKKYNNKYEKIKKIYSLEKLKVSDFNKYTKLIKDKKIHKILVCKANEKLNEYVNRDKNATKNMNNIVLSYINTNYRPKQFVMGTKICEISKMVL